MDQIPDLNKKKKKKWTKMTRFDVSRQKLLQKSRLLRSIKRKSSAKASQRCSFYPLPWTEVVFQTNESQEEPGLLFIYAPLCFLHIRKALNRSGMTPVADVHPPDWGIIQTRVHCGHPDWIQSVKPTERSSEKTTWLSSICMINVGQATAFRNGVALRSSIRS